MISFSRHKKVLISPSVLLKHAIPFNRVIQRAGEFMVTFSRSYHAGFNRGFNCAEAVNFATPCWVPHGLEATYCKCNTKTVRIDMAKLNTAWTNKGRPKYYVP